MTRDYRVEGIEKISYAAPSNARLGSEDARGKFRPFADFRFSRELTSSGLGKRQPNGARPCLLNKPTEPPFGGPLDRQVGLAFEVQIRSSTGISVKGFFA
jgi:hypothetical protein